MPDITMCRTEGCPLKETCYRYKAKPNEVWQSWFIGMECGIKYVNNECPYYWPMKGEGDDTDG